MREALYEPVDLIFPDDEVELINKFKGNFKCKMLSVDLDSELVLEEKIKGPTVAAKRILDTFNITVTPQSIGQMKKSIVDTCKQAHKESSSKRVKHIQAA